MSASGESGIASPQDSLDRRAARIAGYGSAVLGAAPDWQRYIVLAPAFVIGAGLIAAVLILLGRAFVETVRQSGHVRLVTGGLVGLAVLIGVLTYLGVQLPKE
jgi:hypothetical protein